MRLTDFRCLLFRFGGFSLLVGGCVRINILSFRTYVRNLNILYLLRIRFLASLRNDTKIGITTQSQRQGEDAF